MDWIQKAIVNWKSRKVKLNPPATLFDIEKTESNIGFKFPEDFKQFYLTINGFAGLDWQEHMFTIFPLEMIVEEYLNSRDKNFISFCDFLLASHFIGFNKNRNGVFKQYNLEDREIIAQSFEEVIEMINSNNALIY